jgi:hypothetical protein
VHDNDLDFQCLEGKLAVHVNTSVRS